MKVLVPGPDYKCKENSDVNLCNLYNLKHSDSQINFEHPIRGLKTSVA